MLSNAISSVSYKKIIIIKKLLVKAQEKLLYWTFMLTNWNKNKKVFFFEEQII